jgi:hypothetical protein
MKKLIVFIIAFILTACLPSAPQVIVTSEVTVTLMPPPTLEATSTPDPTTTPTAETVTMGNVKFSVDENGVMTIVEATGADEATKAENRAKVDPEAWGFEKGEVEIINIDGKIFITPTGDSDTRIAEWVGGFAGGWKWQWDELEKLPGGNPIFETAKLWEMDKNFNEVDRERAESDSVIIEAFASTSKTKIPGDGKSFYNDAIYLRSQDGKVIGAVLKSKDTKNLDPSLASSGSVEGIIFYLDKDGKTVRTIWAEDINLLIRYWRMR